MKVADFNKSTLAIFAEHWNKSDSPWRVRVELFADWEAQIAFARLLTVPNFAGQGCGWWDTPQGFILIGSRHDGRHLSRYDAPWRLKQLHPEFAGVDDFAYPFGKYFPAKDKNSAYIIIGYGDHWIPEWSGNDYIKNHRRISELQTTLGLSQQDRVEIVVDDF